MSLIRFDCILASAQQLLFVENHQCTLLQWLMYMYMYMCSLVLTDIVADLPTSRIVTLHVHMFSGNKCDFVICTDFISKRMTVSNKFAYQ